jgi:hypothetical protein
VNNSLIRLLNAWELYWNVIAWLFSLANSAELNSVPSVVSLKTPIHNVISRQWVFRLKTSRCALNNEAILCLGLWIDWIENTRSAAQPFFFPFTQKKLGGYSCEVSFINIGRVLSYPNDYVHSLNNVSDRCAAFSDDYYYSLGGLPMASIIISFHGGETWDNLLHTLHSIFLRTPASLLQEVILIDDFSNKGRPKEIYNYCDLLFGMPKYVRMHCSELFWTIRSIFLYRPSWSYKYCWFSATSFDLRHKVTAVCVANHTCEWNKEQITPPFLSDAFVFGTQNVLASAESNYKWCLSLY